MATVNSYTININKISADTGAIRSSILNSQKSIQNINNAFLKKTKIRSEIFQRRQELNRRRLENESRREQEDVLEYSKMSSISKTPGLALARTGKSFLGRIMDFISNLAIGWLLYNLPTWIGMAKEFAGRVIKLGNIIGTIVSSASGIVISLGQGLVNIVGDIAKLNFAALPNDVSSAFNQVQTNIDNMGKQFEEGFKLFSTGLDKSLTGTDIPQVGQPLPEQPYNPGLSSSESGGGGQMYESAGGQKIKKSEFGNRGFRTRDGLGSGATAFGHTGRDVPMASGTPLSIVATGVVHFTASGNNGGFGNLVVIKLDDGRYIKINHLSKILVKQGDKVGAGSGANGGVRVIGLVGSTGLSTGPHMHIDVGSGFDRGSYAITGLVDPDGFILGGGVVRGGDVKSTGNVSQTSPGPKPPIAQPQNGLMGQPIPSGGTLSTPQLVALAKQAGMTKQVNVKNRRGDVYSGPLDVLMAAVAMQESTGKSSIFRTDTQVYGLWQIQFPTHRAALAKIGITSAEQLKDPLTNAKAAKMVYDSQGITAWEGFTDGNYKKFLPDAQKAAGIAPSQLTAGIAPSQFSSPSSGTGSMTAAGITPTSVGEDISIVIPEMGLSSSGGGGGGGQQSYGGGMGVQAPAESPATVLNNFVKNHLLVELAYL
jgi:murein DD-endopeptidase MepM/ murein hydrolase activator NlpD